MRSGVTLNVLMLSIVVMLRAVMLSVVMLNVVMLSIVMQIVFMLNVVILNVVILSVIMLCVAAPLCTPKFIFSQKILFYKDFKFLHPNLLTKLTCTKFSTLAAPTHVIKIKKHAVIKRPNLELKNSARTTFKLSPVWCRASLFIEVNVLEILFMSFNSLFNGTSLA